MSCKVIARYCAVAVDPLTLNSHLPSDATDPVLRLKMPRHTIVVKERVVAQR